MNRIKSLTCVVTTLLLVIFATIFAAPGSFSKSLGIDSKYRVFCANNKVEVEQRTLEQQKNARGSNVCVLGEFDYLSDAEKDAEQKGGKGAECKCP